MIEVRFGLKGDYTEGRGYVEKKESEELAHGTRIEFEITIEQLRFWLIQAEKRKKALRFQIFAWKGNC